MSAISAGARRLPLHHVTIRVPWHDGGWTGTVCARPLDNSRPSSSAGWVGTVLATGWAFGNKLQRRRTFWFPS